MRYFDAVIIGSGYTSLGFALAQKRLLICEESESCDVEFCSALKSFKKVSYEPKTQYGKELLAHYEELGLFSEDQQNCSIFECGFCGFAMDKPVEFLLKCRVLQVCDCEEGKLVTLLTNSGLEQVCTNLVVSAKAPVKEKVFSLLFSVNDPQADLSQVQQIFPEGMVEPAFYENRGALHIPVTADADYNRVLEEVFDRWNRHAPAARIILLASRFGAVAAENTEMPMDASFDNPIAAFEAGYLFGLSRNAEGS